MTDWRLQAACRGLNPDLFFPGRGDHETLSKARETCAVCPVTHECLAYVLTIRGYEGRPAPGVWAGLSERERRTRRPSKPHRQPWWERHPEQADLARQMVAEGATQTEMSDILGISRDVIRNWLYHIAAQKNAA